MNKYSIKPGESAREFLFRLFSYKDQEGLSWRDIANIYNEEFHEGLSGETARGRVRRMLQSIKKEMEEQPLQLIPNDLDDFDQKLFDIRKEKYKIADERNQVNALYRRVAREDTLKEIAHDFASQINEKFLLDNSNKYYTKYDTKRADACGILCISDWHYGIDIDNFYNKYNPEIAKERIQKLQDKVINLIRLEHLDNIKVLNLGDLIAGRIHLQLKINSRIDVITQTMEVAELLAEFLNNISNYAKVDYYSTLDNHSRLEPNIKDSIDLESLVRVIDWFLPERLANNTDISFHKNTFSDDIITFKCLGYNIVGVHGHKDKPNKIIDGITTYTHTHQDLILSAHYHHFSAEEKNETL